MNKTENLDSQALFEMLDQLLHWSALEFCEVKDSGNEKLVLIPYVMNDSVECYLKLDHCTIRGSLEEEMEDSDLEVLQDQEKRGVIIRQPSGNIVTVWFQNAYRIANCYQYHMIGHAWRKERGEEDIRRLVNLLCVLHDKRGYLGAEFCNEDELWLADLVEFAPLLYYTPINESISTWYPCSQEGIEAIKKLSVLAGETQLTEQILKYEALFRKGKIKEKQIKSFAEHFTKEFYGIWEEAAHQITKASLKWPQRTYSKERNEKIIENREKLLEKYLAQGFRGEYPVLRKAQERISFVEEHPFTVMEEEHFNYRIFSIHHYEGKQACIWQEEMQWLF